MTVRLTCVLVTLAAFGSAPAAFADGIPTDADGLVDSTEVDGSETPDFTGGPCGSLVEEAAKPVQAIAIDESLYPYSAAHWKAAIAEGKPATLTLRRDLAEDNRKTWSSKVEGRGAALLDRDEYPFAATLEGGLGAADAERPERIPSIRYIPAEDNRGSGSAFGNGAKSLCNGQRFTLTFFRPKQPVPWEGSWTSDYGNVNVWVGSGGQAFGQYSIAKNARLTGKVAGKTFSGSWKAQGRGTFAFRLDDTASVFTGRWKRASDAKSALRSWDGTRVCQDGASDTVGRLETVAVSEVRVVRRVGIVETIDDEPADRRELRAVKDDPRTLKAPGWVRTYAGSRASIKVGEKDLQIPPGTQIRLVRPTGKEKFKLGDFPKRVRDGKTVREVQGRWWCPLPEYTEPKPYLSIDQPSPPADPPLPDPVPSDG